MFPIWSTTRLDIEGRLLVEYVWSKQYNPSFNKSFYYHYFFQGRKSRWHRETSERNIWLLINFLVHATWALPLYGISALYDIHRVFVRDLYQSILYYHESLTPYSDFYCAGFAVTVSGIKNKFIEEVILKWSWSYIIILILCINTTTSVFKAFSV